jgi:hypothetical protein
MTPFSPAILVLMSSNLFLLLACPSKRSTGDSLVARDQVMKFFSHFTKISFAIQPFSLHSIHDPGEAPSNNSFFIYMKKYEQWGGGDIGTIRSHASTTDIFLQETTWPLVFLPLVATIFLKQLL